MSIPWRAIIGLLVWGAAMLGVLQISQLSGHDHSLCGPWLESQCTYPD